jgi:hypothetical protein
MIVDRLWCVWKSWGSSRLSAGYPRAANWITLILLQRCNWLDGKQVYGHFYSVGAHNYWSVRASTPLSPHRPETHRFSRLSEVKTCGIGVVQLRSPTKIATTNRWPTAAAQRRGLAVHRFLCHRDKARRSLQRKADETYYWESFDRSWAGER